MEMVRKDVEEFRTQSGKKKGWMGGGRRRRDCALALLLLFFSCVFFLTFRSFSSFSSPFRPSYFECEKSKSRSTSLFFSNSGHVLSSFLSSRRLLAFARGGRRRRRRRVSRFGRRRIRFRFFSSFCCCCCMSMPSLVAFSLSLLSFCMRRGLHPLADGPP